MNDKVLTRMKRLLSLTPSLSLRLEQIRAAREADIGADVPVFPRWRASADVLGMAMFFMLLGAYLVARL